MKLFPLALLGSALALSVLSAAPASAKPYVPGKLQSALDMPCAPPCIVCHTKPEGGIGTALKPFAQNMLEHGLDVYSPDSVAEAAQNLDDGTDGDADGIPDIQELKQGLDPNDPVAGASLCGPEYGCLRIGRHGRVDGYASASAAAVLLVGIALLRRQRSKDV